jgi:Flp pilus assembly protein TadD
MFYRTVWVFIVLFAAVPWAVLFFIPTSDFDRLDREAGALLASDKYYEAVDVWEEAARLRPRSFRPRVGMAVAYSYVDRHDMAEKLFAEARELAPSSPVPWHEYGLYKLRRDELEAAESAFKKAIDVDPTWYDVHYHLGLVYEKQGDLEAAQREWIEELAQNPGNSVCMLRYRRTRAEAKMAGARERPFDQPQGGRRPGRRTVENH